jgi:hypothetical protein
MCKQDVIPFDGVPDESLRCKDAPVIVFTAMADQLSAIVLLVCKSFLVQKSKESWLILFALDA